MKKLIIAAAIVCAAVVSQAASMSWGVDYSYQPGADTDEGPFANGWAIACFDANGAKTRSQILEMLSAGSIEDALDYAIGGVKKGDEAGGAKSNGDFIESVKHTDTENGQADAFLVLFNNADAADATLYYATATTAGETPASGTMGTFTFGDDGDLLESANEGGWNKISSVPEPTSGLLLLLGVAGLALKRRRA